ncbi:MAG TPA: hypothetical protein VG102_02025 [Candidatus Paceibacterota bacterium]|jgi:hypothetical protein|nr:hypothetical protein [Candidatus Paceibacterota bacterium]
MNFSSAYSALSHAPIDLLIIGIFFLLVAADALRAGSIRAAALALSLPLSSLLYQMVAQTVLLSTIVGQFSKGFEQAILFFLIEAVLFVCLHQMLSSFERYTSLLSAVVSGLAATVVVLVVWTQTPVLQSVWHFGPQIEALFGAPYRFFWFMASYLALAFLAS